MNEFSFLPGRVDHEVRFISPETASTLNCQQEPVFFSKITNQCNLVSQNNRLSSYLTKHYLDGCIVRTLPINNSSKYYQAAKELDEYSSLTKSLGLNVNQVLPFPNPEHISISEFSHFVADRASSVIGFELISSWHQLPLDHLSYQPYIELIIDLGLELFLEVDHSFRFSFMHLYRAVNIIKKHSPHRVWLPHLGCGAFLYPDLFDELQTKIVLLTSVPKSLHWLDLCKSTECKNMTIAFASDAPYDANMTLKLYSLFFKTYGENNC